VATTILLAITLLFIFLSSSYSETIILFSFLWTKLKEWQIWISALPPIILILLQKLYGLKHQADRLIKKYANLPSYKNHLGIQELLEDDLRNLIIASTKGACFFKWTWPFSGKGFPKRFLLIVDDLDRCEPSEMLFVIENLMLLLNEKGIKERLHIILIMEEDVLCLALVEKYKQLIMLEKKLDSPAAVKYEEFIAHQIVDENIEKLIICYLRLNPLTPEEIEEAVIKFTNKDLPENKKLSMPSENTQNQSIGYSDIKASVNVTKPQSAALGGDKRNTEAELNNDDYVYSHVERRQILDYINEYGKRADKPWGPRAIRAFLFKYQLAKLLLREMGQPVDSTKIIDCFKKTKEKDKKHLDETGDIVRAVVEQVR
jgi:hypothetical protein